MAEDTEVLDEVVVVGYGVQKNRMLQVQWHVSEKRIESDAC